MANHVRKHAAILRTIQKARPDLRKSLIQLADEDLIRCICECADNTLKGNVKLTPAQHKKLSRYKKVLRRIAKKGESWRAKRKVISQCGGALPALLIPILGTVVTSLISAWQKK
jgi:hypothetical protein